MLFTSNTTEHLTISQNIICVLILYILVTGNGIYYPSLDMHLIIYVRALLQCCVKVEHKLSNLHFIKNSSSLIARNFTHLLLVACLCASDDSPFYSLGHDSHTLSSQQQEKYCECQIILPYSPLAVDTLFMCFYMIKQDFYHSSC